VEKIGQKKMQKVQNYHRQLSNIYGVNVGVISDQPAARNNNMEQMLYDLTFKNEEPEAQIQVNHRQIILSFLRAKDDNMILLITGLLA
jgi:hypothetical protein